MGRLRAERGATVVEAAIVAPLFFLLVVAIIEGGLLFRTHLTATNASRDAARAASASDNRAYTDYEILQSVAKGTAGVSRADVVQIVVFLGTKAAGHKSAPQFTCDDIPAVAVPGFCNVYSAADLDLTRTQFGAGTYTKDDTWSATSRDWNLGGFGPDAGTDYLGVKVTLNHTSVTGVLGSTRKLSSTTVMRLEPMEALQ
jgi:hypothetical protein